MTARRKKIAMVLYSNPDTYPSTASAIKILCEDFDLLFLSRNYELVCASYPENVRVYRVGKSITMEAANNQSAIKKVIEYTRFIFVCLWRIRRCGCRLVYAYDMHALVAAIFTSVMGKKLPVIFHSHDLYECTERFSLGSFINWLHLRLSRYAKKVVFPDMHRAQYFKNKARLKSSPEIVMNAPLRVLDLPKPRLREALAAQGVEKGAKVVFYQGGIDTWRSIPETIASMQMWPEGSVFVLAGTIYTPQEKDELFRAIEKPPGGKKIIYLGFVPHDELFEYTCAADLGLAFYKPSTQLQGFYGAGGSNKMFEYMALGVPCVTTDMKQFKELLGEDDFYFADPFSPSSIGQAIALALNDEEGRRRKSQALRQLHLERYNYETQFAPILEFIRNNV